MYPRTCSFYPTTGLVKERIPQLPENVAFLVIIKKKNPKTWSATLSTLELFVYSPCSTTNYFPFPLSRFLSSPYAWTLPYNCLHFPMPLNVLTLFPVNFIHSLNGVPRAISYQLAEYHLCWQVGSQCCKSYSGTNRNPSFSDMVPQLSAYV